MKIFFACSMRGGFDKVNQEELKKIPEIIKFLGHSLMSEHQISSNFIKEENVHTSTEIHDRDYKWLVDCDLVIAEISNPSLGVGGEISDAINLKKPVLMIFQSSLDEESLSAYSRGKVGSQFINSIVDCKPYKNIEDLKQTIDGFLKTINGANPDDRRN